ncbi:MAG: alpha/beta fold hydrolase [Solirubrobacteraceae bacterium]
MSKPAPSLFLLHGFTHTGRSWDPVRTALGTSYRVLTPDLRGHGSASDLVPVSLEAVLSDLEAIVPEHFTLAGYSMGGRLALHAALTLAGRVERLVLIGSSPGIADPAERAARRADDEGLASEIEASGIETFARRWALTPVLAGQPPEVAAAVHADRLCNTTAGLARALRGLGTGALPSLWDRLGELEMDVMMIVGEHDRKFTSLAGRMAEWLPAGRVEVVRGAGHAVHLEAPRRVAELIAA